MTQKGEAMSPADETLKRAAEAFYSATHAYHDEHPDPPFDAAYRDAQIRHGALAFVRSLAADGWACIPREATTEMFYAWVRNIPGGSEYNGGPDFTSGWDAAIATAPRLTGDER